MRWRVILGLSLLANLILAVVWWRTPASDSPPAADSSGGTNTLTGTNRPTVVVRRQFFSWQQLESQDYATYIKNLREIGCPEQTIRDIIIADVTEMLRGKYRDATSGILVNPKWWTNFRDETETAAENSQAERMWVERNNVLQRLLGPDWAVRQNASSTTRPNPQQELILATLEVNPVLQALTAEQKQQLATLLSGVPGHSAAEVSAESDATEAAKEKARWAKLSASLTPDQLEAAKLHFALGAENWRAELDALPGFNTRPEEFRNLFRQTEQIDLQLAALEGRSDDVAQQERIRLLTLRDAAVRSSLTKERYELYVRLNDPAYLEAIASLGQQDPNSAAVRLLYAINREKAAEEERIQANPGLTDLQREIELKRLELELLKATAEALGETLPPDPAAPPRPKSEPMKVHQALPGEGLERLARVYGVPPEAIRTANPNLNFDRLPPGASVNIPLRLIYPLPPPPQ